MSIPILQIYAAIGAPSEANQMQGIGKAQFESMLSQAVATGEKKAQVRLNSGGGSWLDAQSIYAMMQASDLNIDTYNDGLAASSASLIFMGGRKRYMAAHARLMIHDCSSPAYGQVADLEKAIEQQRNINESLATIYVARSGQSLEKVREMMAKETWLSAPEALALGFCDFIVPTAYQAPPAALTANTPAELVTACLHSYYAQLTPSLIMKNLLLPIMAAAGVVAVTDASADTEIAAQVQAAYTERDTLKREKQETEEKLATATATVQELTDKQKATDEKLEQLEKDQAAKATADAEANATKVVEEAVASGKILASAKPHFLAMAKTDIGSVTAALAAMPGKKGITEITNQTTEGAVGSLAASSVMAEINARTSKKPE